VTDLFNVKGKNVLVTGGGRGIGEMIASGFVRNGANVFICSRDQKAITETAQHLSQRGPGKCTGIAIDLSKGLDSAKKLIDILKNEYHIDKLDVLVNNSGNSWGEPFEKFSEKGWDHVMNLNVKAMFFVTQQALPLLSTAANTSDPARIINIGSVAGVQVQHVSTWSYDVSKAAVHHLTKKFAAELASKNITANAIAPGFVPSKMSKQLLTYNTEDQLRNAVPLKRFALPGDMAAPALFFASPGASWITGQVLVVDGGQLSVPSQMIDEGEKPSSKL
jgi:NAD(P)-dependent dehydrogenase (short-subunit alcohol dehydrogenase family)